jgi:hypothetical protein
LSDEDLLGRVLFFNVALKNGHMMAQPVYEPQQSFISALVLEIERINPEFAWVQLVFQMVDYHRDLRVLDSVLQDHKAEAEQKRTFTDADGRTHEEDSWEVDTRWYRTIEARTKKIDLLHAKKTLALGIQGMWVGGVADLSHLATNAVIGLVLLGLAMGRYGTGTGMLAAYLAGAGGNLLAGLISLQTHRSLGASGMVMGSLGLLAVQSFSLWRQTPHARKFILSGVCGGVMLVVLLALTPGTDVMAHLGGFVSGLLLGALLNLVPSVAQRPNANLLSGLAFALLVIVPWWLALRSAVS